MFGAILRGLGHINNLGGAIAAIGGGAAVIGGGGYWAKEHFGLFQSDAQRIARHRNILINKSMEYSSSPIVTRGTEDKKLTPGDVRLLKQTFTENGNKDIAVIMNVGRKRMGKSTTSCIESLLLCDHGGRFEIGRTTEHETFGIYSGPPMTPSYNSLHPKPKCKLDVNKHNISIVDVEGLEDKNKDQMMELLKHWMPVTTVIVHVVLNSLENEDYLITKKMHELMNKHRDKNGKKIRYMVVAATNLKDIKESEIWQDIKRMAAKIHFDEPELCILPMLDKGVWDLIDEKKSQNKSYPNLLGLMRDDQIEQYMEFSSDLIQNFKETTTASEMIQVFNKTQDMIHDLENMQLDAIVYLMQKL